MVTDKIRFNAQKIMNLVALYPDNTFDQTIALLQMPAIDINTAVWYAIDMGWITEPDPETKKSSLVLNADGTAPDLNIDDPNFKNLEDAIIYGFEKLAEKENDLEEFSLSQWTNGYPAHDVMIAMKGLLVEEVLAEYVIEDGKENYTFYTLFKNKDKLWGRKQFKKDPLKAEK